MRTTDRLAKTRRISALVGIITMSLFLFLSIYMYITLQDEDVLIMGAIGVVAFLLFLSALERNANSIMLFVLLLLSLITFVMDEYVASAIFLVFAATIAIILLFKNSN
jgi:membrane-bound ClpP family serine protease